MRTVEVLGEVYVLGVTGNTEYLGMAYVPKMKTIVEVQKTVIVPKMKSDSEVLQSVHAVLGMNSPGECLQWVPAVDDMKSALLMEEEYCVPVVKLAGLSVSVPLSPGLLSPAPGRGARWQLHVRRVGLVWRCGC